MPQRTGKQTRFVQFDEISLGPAAYGLAMCDLCRRDKAHFVKLSGQVHSRIGRNLFPFRGMICRDCIEAVLATGVVGVTSKSE